MANNKKNRFEEIGGSDVVKDVISESGLQQKSITEKPKPKVRQGRERKEEGQRFKQIGQMNGTEDEKKLFKKAYQQAGFLSGSSYLRSLLMKEGVFPIPDND